jgi:hypothetical protein
MVIVQDLVEAAYASSTANDPGKLALDNELYNHLNRTFQLRYALWSKAVGDTASDAPLVLTFSGTPPTVPLPTDIIDIDRFEIAGTKGYLIPIAEKERTWHLAPSIYRQGLSLVSRGQTGDPIIGTVMTLWIDDAPATLSSLSSTIDIRFPVRFHKLLILDLALYLDTKDEGRDPAQHQKLVDELQNEEQMFSAVLSITDPVKREAMVRENLI